MGLEGEGVTFSPFLRRRMFSYSGFGLRTEGINQVEEREGGESVKKQETMLCQRANHLHLSCQLRRTRQVPCVAGCWGIDGYLC